MAVNKLLAETNWTKYDALIHNGNAAFNLEDNGGAQGDTFFHSLAPVLSQIPYMIVPGERDMAEGGRLIGYRYRMPGGGNRLNIYSYRQGAALFVFVNPRPFLNMDAEEKVTFLTTLSSTLQSSTHSWRLVILSSSLSCYPGDSDCGDNIYSLRPILNILEREHVHLLIENVEGRYSRQTGSGMKNRYYPDIESADASLSHVVYGISGNKVGAHLTSQSPLTSLSHVPATIPEESVLVLTVNQFSLQVELVDASTGQIVDRGRWYRGVARENMQYQGLIYWLFILVPLFLLCPVALSIRAKNLRHPTGEISESPVFTASQRYWDQIDTTNMSQR